jgi:hypothetical protein
MFAMLKQVLVIHTLEGDKPDGNSFDTMVITQGTD